MDCAELTAGRRRPREPTDGRGRRPFLPTEVLGSRELGGGGVAGEKRGKRRMSRG